MKTFSEDEAERAYKLLKEENPNKKEIDQIVDEINFLDKKEFEDPELLKSYTEDMTKKIKEIIIIYNEKIKHAFTKMHEHISKRDFNSI